MPMTLDLGGSGGALSVRSGALPLKIVIGGQSIPGGNGTGHVRDRIAALRPSPNVVLDETVGDTSIVDAIAAFNTDIAPLFDEAYRCIYVYCDTIVYCNDVRGEWGDGDTLVDPNGVGDDYYTLTLTLRDLAHAAGFEFYICTAPAAYETTSADPPTNNALYQQSHDRAHSNIRTNASAYVPGGVIDIAADPAFQDTTDGTYYDGSRIHLSDPVGHNRFGDDVHAGLP